MENFKEKLDAFLSDFGKCRKMVLSTSENDKVSSRMMSVVQIDGKFWFQTDKNMRKYHQILANRNAALCIDNIQMEGVCEEKGQPLDNDSFCSRFRECFKGSFEAYTSLENERLFVFTPLYIQRWLYKDGVPYIEIFDLENHQYTCEKYSGGEKLETKKNERKVTIQEGFGSKNVDPA